MSCFLKLFSNSCALFSLYVQQKVFILSRTNVTNWHLSAKELFPIRALIHSSSPAHSVAIFIPHISPIVSITTYVSILRDLLDPVPSFFWQGVPPSRTSPLIDFLIELVTEFDFSSQTHTMARHIHAATLSCRKGKPICIHIYLAILNVRVYGRRPMFLLCVFHIGTSVTLSWFPILRSSPSSVWSTTSFHSQTQRLH